MSESVDYLIVGGGLAGHILQIELEEKGFSTVVIDKSKSNVSSVIAAGIVNPIAGKFFTLTWRANEIFNDLATYYQNLENRFKARFFTPKKLKRIFATAGEQNIWLSKAHQEKYKNYCSFINSEIKGLKTNYGVLEIDKGGQLNIVEFLTNCKSHFNNIDERFDYESLDLNSNKYKHLNFKKVVFCEGYTLLNNKLFSYLPIVPTKGELIEIETDLAEEESIFLGPVFLQHVKDRRWRVGATYAPNETSLEKTDEKKMDLISKLDKIIDVPYKVVEQKVGIRPATIDRRPLLGVHKKYPNVFVFNGFGSKGVSLIPLLAKEFVDFAANNAPLHPEVNADRF